MAQSFRAMVDDLTAALSSQSLEDDVTAAPGSHAVVKRVTMTVGSRKKVKRVSLAVYSREMGDDVSAAPSSLEMLGTITRAPSSLEMLDTITRAPSSLEMLDTITRAPRSLECLDEFGGLFERMLERDPTHRGRRVYIMYHGTTLTAALKIQTHGFRQSSDGMLGRGVYVSRSFQKASAYPKILPPLESRVVLKLSVRVGKVIKIDRQGHPLQKSWHDHGYDTAWVPPDCGMVTSGLEEDCVWNPKRIRVLQVIHVE